MTKTTEVDLRKPISDRLLDEGVKLVVVAASEEGIRISGKTAIRWCLAGVRGVRLENLKVRGRRMTSRAAIRRFIAATQERPSPAQVVLDHAGADKVLVGFGL